MSTKSKRPPGKGKEPAAQSQYHEKQPDKPTVGDGGCYTSSLATGLTSSVESTTPTQTVPRSSSIRSESEITLQGPVEIAGSVRSGGNLIFNGDFDVRDKVEAYGAIEVNGNLACDGKMKAYGNIQVTGHMFVGDKAKGFGKLKVTGTCEAREMEVYGNTTINGYLKCKRLILYGSLTIIGQNSGYHVEDEEKVWGSVIRREKELDW